MGDLLSRLLARPRLTSALAGGDVAVIEAAGGFGKSILATQFAEEIGGANVRIAARQGVTTGAQVIAELRRSLRRVGLTNLSAVLDGMRSPDDALADLLRRLDDADAPVVLVIDDAHLLSAAARSLTDLLAGALTSPHHLLLLTRPSPAPTLPETVTALDADDLAFTDEETAELARTRGVDIDDDGAAELRRSTGGWAAALALAIAHLARSPHPDLELRRITAGPTMVARLVDECLTRLAPHDREASVQLSHLPVLSRGVAGAVTGDADVLDRLVAAGLPMSATGDASWRFAGPVGEHLTSLAPLRLDTAVKVADAYVALHSPSAGVATLLAAGGAAEAAALIERLPALELDRLELEEVEEVVDTLTAEEADHHGFTLVAMARKCEGGGAYGRGAGALVTAGEVAARTGDRVLANAVDAETANGLNLRGQLAEAAALAKRTLANVTPAEPETRLQLLKTLGSAYVIDPGLGSVEAGVDMLNQVIVEGRRLGDHRWVAQASSRLAYHVHFPAGRFDEAVACLEGVIELLPGRARPHAVYLTLVAEFLCDCGRYDDAFAALERARRVGEDFGDPLTLAYVAWDRARIASQRGERAEVLRWVAEVERHRGDWFFEHSTGAAFLADAADLLDRVGATAEAHAYLERARERRDELTDEFALAEAVVTARSGDPSRAAQLLAEVAASPALAARERWRVVLLQALAALRAGDRRAGALAAQAFTDADALGWPQLPFIRERNVAEQLVALAVDAGCDAAARAATASLPVAMQVLGGFEVRRGGRDVTPAPGRPAEALKIVTSSRDGRVGVEELIDRLWPDADADTGRVRLRNVLARIADTCGPVLERDGDSVRLATDVAVDAVVFDDESRRAQLAASAGNVRAAVALARVALARYRGDLLPDERYEAWAASRREELRRRRLALLDLCAADAETGGEVDEALRLLRAGIEVDPTDEDRYLRAGEILHRHGRRGAARQILNDLDGVLDDLGLPPSARHRDLERSLSS